MKKKKLRKNHGTKDFSKTKIDSPRRPGGFSFRLREMLMLSLLPLLVFLIYSNALQGPFLFDDVHNIQDNPNIRLTRLSLGGVTRAGFESPSPNRPAANISFALNHYFHQYNVTGYHWVNILIHVTAGIFLYLFVKTTLSLPSLRSRYKAQKWIPFITVLIWLVHPLQTQSVTYIVQRMNSMAAMFYVLSLLLYARARLSEEKGKKRALFGGCIIAGILSLGSKEIATTLPLFIFLYEWYFFQDLSWGWLKRHFISLAGILIFLAIVALIYLDAHPFEKILTTYGNRDFTLTQRVLTEFRVVIFYITLLVFPHPSRLNLDHDFPISYSMVDPVTTLLSMGAIAGLMGLAIYMAKKERLLSFCILWFLGNLVIESSVIGLEIIFEHRTYLPSMFVSLLAVTLGYRYIKSKWWKVGMLCAVLVVFSVWTYERNSVWGDDVTLWKDCVKKSPKKARIHYALGVALASKGEIEKAMGHYYDALKIKPDYADAHNNLGAVLNERGELKEAMSHYSQALRIKPDHADALNNLGASLYKQGNLKQAIIYYSQALQAKPDFAEAHNNLGVALNRQGSIKEAMSHFYMALRSSSDYADAHYNLGNAMKREGRLNEAIGHYSEALRIKPHFAEAHLNLGVVLVGQNRVKEAISHYHEALRINPDYGTAHNNLGNALAGQGRVKEAIGHFSEVLRINPNDADAHYNLGNALASQKRAKEAIGHYSEALRINPDDVEARRNMERVLGLMGK